MSNPEELFARLRTKGLRLTKVRTALLEILSRSVRPLSPLEIQGLLRRRSIKANKTTVYRELSTLQDTGMVRELQLTGRAKQYELISDDHHHHLICVECKSVEDVEMPKDLDQEERKIAAARQFIITSHSLEFYGVCAACTATT